MALELGDDDESQAQKLVALRQVMQSQAQQAAKAVSVTAQSQQYEAPKKHPYVLLALLGAACVGAVFLRK